MSVKETGKSRPPRDSLRSKRFRLVSEQRKTEEQDSRFWPREKWNKSQKMKVEGEGKGGNLRHFLRGLWLSFLVLCSETARKRLLRRLTKRKTKG